VCISCRKTSSIAREERLKVKQKLAKISSQRRKKRTTTTEKRPQKSYDPFPLRAEDIKNLGIQRRNTRYVDRVNNQEKTVTAAAAASSMRGDFVLANLANRGEKVLTSLPSSSPVAAAAAAAIMCDLCNLSFTRPDSYKSHLIMVHKVNYDLLPFKCNGCELRFESESRMARHAVTHTGEKNFKCDLCNEFFSQKNNLNRHIQRKHAKGA
jgi:hypothetical protein